MWCVEWRSDKQPSEEVYCYVFCKKILGAVEFNSSKNLFAKDIQHNTCSKEKRNRSFLPNVTPCGFARDLGKEHLKGKYAP